MASKRKSTIPCMIPVKTMHMRDDVEHDLPCIATKDSAYASREDLYGQGYLDLGEPSRHDSGDALKDGGTYTCRPCNFETPDLNLFLDHVYSGHPEFRSDPSFHCVDCGVTAAKFEGLALHNARVHPSTVTTTLQLRKRERKVIVEQSLILGPGDSLLSPKSDSEISITKTPIMKMLRGKSEHKRIVVSHSGTDDSRLEAGVTVVAGTGRPSERKDPPSVTVTHVPTIVHNGSTSKVTLPSAIQIVNGSGALPILKTAVTQVVSVVQNRNLHQHSTPITMSSSPSSSSSSHSSKNLPKVMIPLSSIPTYNAAMDNSSFLKTSFSKFPYPTKAELCYLTVVTKYPEEQIKIWFTAQRLKQGISWSPEEIEEARRKMFNTIIQTAPPSGHHHHTTVGRQTHHGTAQQTFTVLPASLGAAGLPQFLQGSLVSQGGVIVTQPMMANGIQVTSAPVALAVTPKPQSATKPMMQARPAAALVADKGVSMVVGTVGSSSSLNYTICSSSSSNGSVSSSSSSNASSSSSIISSSSSSRSNSRNSGSQMSVISTGVGTIITTTISNNNSNGKTSIISGNNINSITAKTNNGNKSTENGKSAVNGKGTAPSVANTKTNQDVKSGSNGKDSSSTVKSTNDGKASPDIKTSTDRKASPDAKSDGKTDGKSNGTSLTTATTTNPTTTTSASTTTANTNSASATAANTAASTTVTTTPTTTRTPTPTPSGHSSSSSSGKKGETATAAAASSPSASASTTPNSRSLSSFLDANSKQNKKSQEQLSALKQSFLSNQFPNQDEVNRLTSLTGLSVREVRKWFSDRRYHFRNLKGPRTSTGGQASGADKTASPGPASGPSAGSSDTPVVSSAERPKTPPPTPTSPPQQQQQTTSPTTPSRRPPRPPSPDFTAIRYKEREPHQLVALEASFLLDPEPSSEEVDRLRQETKMTRREIHGWFAERRKRAAAEKKKEEAEKAQKEEKEEAEACVEEGLQKSEPVKEEVKEEKMSIDEHSGGDAASSLSSSQQVKEEKQKDDAPKVNPIKINLKMLKVTESSGKEGEANPPVQADHPKTASPAPAPATSPIPVPSTPYRGKKTADQLHALKQAFARTQWPGSPQYDELMARTGLPRPEVVRWFGDCRYVLKNGQLKWLESYQTMVEEEDYQKANLDVLKEHLEARGALDETQVKELAKGSGLTEDLVRRWFTNRAPLLLAAKKEEEVVEEGSAGTATATATAGEVETEKVKVKEESKVDGAPAPAAVAQQDQGSVSEEKMEQSPPASTTSTTTTTAATTASSTSSTHDSEKTMTADVKSTNPKQEVA